jgi:hypothetical protein
MIFMVPFSSPEATSLLPSIWKAAVRSTELISDPSAFDGQILWTGKPRGRVIKA